MRCTRCDGLVVPQAVGRTPAGVLVFGWCRRCMAEEGCVVVDVDAPASRSGPRRRRPPAGRRPPGRRRVAVLAIAGVLALWAVALTAMGVAGRPGPLAAQPGVGRAGAYYLAGGGFLALASLSLWVAVLDDRAQVRFLGRVVLMAAAVAGLGSLADAARRSARPDLWAAAAGSFAAGVVVGLAARRAIRRRRASSPSLKI